MLKPHFTQFILCVLILSTWPQSVLAYLNQNSLQTEYIEDLCSFNKPKLHLTGIGKDSALRIISKNGGDLTKDYTHCIVKISSAFKGVILTLDSTTDFYFEENDGYVQLIPYYKNSSKQSHQKSSYASSSIKLAFSKCCKPEEELTIIATSYRLGTGEGSCSSEREFPCESGQCIGRQHFCDGIKNCPDGSDELFPKLCMLEPTLSSESDWNYFTTTRSVKADSDSLNLTVTVAVLCLFLIFALVILRIFCHYKCAERQTQQLHDLSQQQHDQSQQQHDLSQQQHNVSQQQHDLSQQQRDQSQQLHAQSRQPSAMFSSISVIRQRPDFQPEDECPPPPSYRSLNVEHPNGNPPPYSTIAATGENSEAQMNDDDAENNVRGPPPPYEP